MRVYVPHKCNCYFVASNLVAVLRKLLVPRHIKTEQPRDPSVCLLNKHSRDLKRAARVSDGVCLMNFSRVPVADFTYVQSLRCDDDCVPLFF